MWWTALFGLLDPVTRITEQIVKARTASLDAGTQQAKIAADERVKSLEAKRDVLVAGANQRVDAWMRGMIAAPVAVLLWKVLVYDKAMGQWTGGRTDPLDPNLWMVVSAVIGFYFLATIFGRR